MSSASLRSVVTVLGIALIGFLPGCDAVSPNTTPNPPPTNNRESSGFTYQLVNAEWMEGYSVRKAIKNQEEVYAWMRNNSTQDELIAAFNWRAREWRVLSDLEGYTLIDMDGSVSGRQVGMGDASQDLLVIREPVGGGDAELAYLTGGTIDIRGIQVRHLLEKVAMPAGSGPADYVVVANGTLWTPGSGGAPQTWKAIDRGTYYGDVFGGARGTNNAYASGGTTGTAVIGGTTAAPLRKSGGESPRSIYTFAYDWVDDRGFLTFLGDRSVYMHNNTGANTTLVHLTDIYEGTYAESPPSDAPTISPYSPLDFEATQLYTRFGKVIDPQTKAVRTYLTLRPIASEEDALAKMRAWDQLYEARYLFREPQSPGVLYWKQGQHSGDPDKPNGWIYYQINPAHVATGTYVDPWRPF